MPKNKAADLLGLRIGSNLTLEEVAGLIGSTAERVETIENGTASTTVIEAKKLSLAYDTSLPGLITMITGKADKDNPELKAVANRRIDLQNQKIMQIRQSLNLNKNQQTQIDKLAIEERERAQSAELLKLKIEVELEEKRQLLIAKLSEPNTLLPEDLDILDRILAKN
jgi:transcriptional regulator with XRE-family HTH domain